MNPSSPQHQARGVLILCFTTLIWGTTFVVTKQTLQNTPASTLVFARFLIAGIVFLPFLRPGQKLWMAALELGTWLWLGFATQTIGLRYTTVDRSAFITALHVIFVPAIGALVGRSSRIIIWLAALLALLGVTLLSNDGSPANPGDLWTLACALCWAFYILRLETFAARFPSKPLTAAHLWVVVILSFAWTCTTHQLHGPVPWKAALYLGLAATAATTWFQTVGQKNVSAPQAAILYTLEPVWASLFAWYILHQSLGPAGWLGASCILIAAVMTQLPIRKFSNR
jgi:drug/metabolite transporter (DMT)-like permease